MSQIANPRVILITGASGAIGQALAIEYAKPDTTLILQGRQEVLLKSLAAQCESLGASVIIKAIDLEDHLNWQSWLGKTLITWPVDLCILNAGLNTQIGKHGEQEPWPTVESLLEVNLKSVMLTVHMLVPLMRSRGSGQIAIMSSLAAWFGLPVTPTYSATKAALKAYGEALRGWLATEGVAVNIIMPGYIHSAMCDQMPGPKPFLMTPKQAAKRIRLGLAANKARISFPFPLNFGTQLLSLLPVNLALLILRKLGYSHAG